MSGGRASKTNVNKRTERKVGHEKGEGKGPGGLPSGFRFNKNAAEFRYGTFPKAEKKAEKFIPVDGADHGGGGSLADREGEKRGT